MHQELEENLMDENFAKRLTGAVTQANGINLTQIVNEQYCQAIGDDNGVHFHEEDAKKAGFTARPMVGTALWEIAGGIGDRMSSHIQARSSGLLVVSAGMKFREAVYPGNSISWSKKKLNLSRDGSGMSLDIELEAKRQNTCVGEYNLTLSNSLPQVQPRDPKKHLYTTDFDVTNRDLELAQKLQLNPVRATLRRSHGAAIATSALVEFMKGLNKKADTSYLGINRAMTAYFFDRMFPGKIRADVYETDTRILKARREGDKDSGLYRFDVDLSQDGKVSTSVQVTCLTTGVLDIYSIKNGDKE